MEYGLYQKLSLYFEVTDKLDVLPMIRLPNVIYSNAKMVGTHVVKYYTLGINMMKTSDFQNDYGNISSFKPRTDHVLLLSVSQALEPNGVNILRRKNRTFLVFPVDLMSIRRNNEVYPNPGTAFNCDDFYIQSAHIDVYTGKITVEARTQAGKSYQETPRTIVSNVKMTFSPMLNELRKAKSTVITRAYQTKEGREGMVELFSEILNHGDIFLPIAKPVREQLIEILKSADASDNNGRNPTHYYPFKDGPDKDLWWPDRTDFEVKMRVNDDDLELVKKKRRAHLRLEQVLSIPLADGQRARAITWDEVKENPDWILNNEDAEVCLLQWGSEASKQMCAKAEQMWKDANQLSAVHTPTTSQSSEDDDQSTNEQPKQKSLAEILAEHMNDNELENLK